MVHDRQRRVAGIGAVVFAGLAFAATAWARPPEVHYVHQGVTPPGAIGKLQLQRGGPLPGYFQPVEIKAPPGALISLATEGRFGDPLPCPAKFGMLIGQVYRLRVTQIPLSPGQEVFPTIEIVDRLYAPIGQERRFAIPIQLTQDDLRLAMQGKFVTRVVYLENPQAALPVAEDPKAQNWYEVRPGEDPLAVADALGRPVAILRLGGRLPEPGATPDDSFLFGCPPFMRFTKQDSTSGGTGVPPAQLPSEEPR